MISAEEVVQGYRLFFGREPESPDAVAQHLGHADRRAFWRVLVDSPEFAAGSAAEAASQFIQARHLFEPPASVQHEADAEQAAAMADRVRRQWSRLGETDPHWSVLTANRYRAEALNEEALDDFWASGRRHAGLLDIFERRSGVVASRGTCLEIGCGVGRVTGPLAERFEAVVATDISQGNIALCRERMAALGADHVTCIRLDDLDALDRLPLVEAVFTTHVLQHNPPPMQKRMIRSMLGRVRPGGVALFQLPTDVPGYGFDVASYLQWPDMPMEMHALPRAVVLAEIRAAGMVLADLTPDPFTGVAGSFTFYAYRPDPTG